MSIPSSPAPCYQPDQLFQSKVKLSNRALDVISSVEHSNVLRRVSSLPNTTTEYFSTSSTTLSTTTAVEPIEVHSTPASPRPSAKSSSSYTLQKHDVQVGPTDFEKIRMLGKGDVGKVYLVKHKVTENLYALKGKELIVV
jgi:protein-serine/threonine kinase